ncbi:hypothetical protein Scep_002438 [Stephania cephalantha]|uniref:F-box/LRR-repeat protein 15-like leucin rich repeat domain-containing protein n=1 Tax=Stephania cephalantha TaxID=152367 RepID=A0AAP0L9X4_9MAGN
MNNLVLAFAPKFTKLQVLSLRQTIPQLEDKAVESVANYCPELLDLDLSKSFKLTDCSLYALAHGCQRLTKLNISGCTAFSDVALSYLTGFCRNLRSLNLCGCTKAASDRALTAIAHNCHRLQYLNLGWCEFVGDAGVMSLARRCPDLRELDLCGCSLITDDSIVALAERCLYLRSLDLYQCHNITDIAMYSLANRGMKSKRDMWKPVGSRYDEGLVNLNLGQCTGLTAQAVQAVCDSFPSLHTCLRQSLTISGCLNLVSVHCACTTGSPILFQVSGVGNCCVVTLKFLNVNLFKIYTSLDLKDEAVEALVIWHCMPSNSSAKRWDALMASVEDGIEVCESADSV